MMSNVKIELRIYSPRWGHDDIYEVELTKEKMTITQGMKSSICTWRDNFDPIWSGNELENILRNDSIYPPAVLNDLLEYAWKAWRGGDLDNASVSNELESVEEWLNIITKAKPRTDFWSRYF